MESSQTAVIISSTKNADKAQRFKSYIDRLSTNVIVISRVDFIVSKMSRYETFIICTDKRDYSSFSNYLSPDVVYCCCPVWWNCHPKDRPLDLISKRGLTPSWLETDSNRIFTEKCNRAIIQQLLKLPDSQTFNEEFHFEVKKPFKPDNKYTKPEQSTTESMTKISLHNSDLIGFDFQVYILDAEIDYNQYFEIYDMCMKHNIQVLQTKYGESMGSVFKYYQICDVFVIIVGDLLSDENLRFSKFILTDCVRIPKTIVFYQVGQDMKHLEHLNSFINSNVLISKIVCSSQSELIAFLGSEKTKKNAL